MKMEMLSFIDSIQELPVMPATTVKLIGLLGNKDTTINQILEVIQYDQNLTMEVLKICNSAYFGLNRKINSLRESLAYLGSKQLMQIVLGIHCNTILQQPQKGYGLLTGMLWRHSTAVAMATEKFVRYDSQTPPPAGLLFTAGLLHDFGKVILDQTLAENYLEILKCIEQTPMKFYEAEREILGYSHMEVGEMIMRHWQLPEVMAAVCRYHHEPQAYPGSDPNIRQILELVHTADILALSLGLGVGNDGLMYEFDGEFASHADLAPEIIEKVGTEVLIEMKSLEHLYQEE